MSSYIGNPYYGSNREARLYTTYKEAVNKLKKLKKPGEVLQIGSGKYKLFAIRLAHKKYYEK